MWLADWWLAGLLVNVNLLHCVDLGLDCSLDALWKVHWEVQLAVSMAVEYQLLGFRQIEMW